MKNLINFSFLLILLPQINLFHWQNNPVLIAANNFQTNLLAQKPSYTQSQEIIGTTTNIESSADQMISYRHQRHMWVTKDGAVHALINRGTNSSGASLVLYSSFDDGKSWNLILSIPNTNSTSTADGFLFKKKLYLAYSSATGSILFLPLIYDDVNKKWTFSEANTVYQNNNFIAASPSIAFDRNGYLWTTFVLQQPYTGNYSIRLFNSSDRGVHWNNTYVNLGAINQSARKSARLVTLKDRLGVIYTNDDTFYWAYRINGSSFDTPWQTQSIFTYQPDSDKSPYASHFSLVADSLDNIHLATRDVGKLIYLKFDNQNQTWKPKKILSNDVSVGYMQTSLSTNNKLYIIYNRLTQLGVFESSDSGESFKFVKLLNHPKPSDFAGETVSFQVPRMIAPAKINANLPLLQQFQINGYYSLIYFNLNVDAPSTQAVSR